MMDRLKRCDAAMAHLKTWIRRKQTLGRIRGKHAYLMGCVKLIQRSFRAYLARQKNRIIDDKAISLQRLLKGIHVRMIVQRKLKAIPVIQRILPMFVARYRYRKFRHGVLKI